MTSNNSSTARAIGAWFKSSLSYPNGNQCVEVRFDTDLVHVRDSKNHGTGPILSVPTDRWTEFLDEATGRAPAGSNTTLQIEVNTDGGANLRAHSDWNTVLSYTPGEWSAFVAGARAGEFDLPRAEVLAGAV